MSPISHAITPHARKLIERLVLSASTVEAWRDSVQDDGGPSLEECRGDFEYCERALVQYISGLEQDAEAYQEQKLWQPGPGPCESLALAMRDRAEARRG